MTASIRKALSFFFCPLTGGCASLVALSRLRESPEIFQAGGPQVRPG